MPRIFILPLYTTDPIVYDRGGFILGILMK